MSRLPFELMLALRYLRPKRTFVSVITLISIFGVMLGVAVLIIVIAVMSGFDQEWHNKILGFNAHLKITHRAGPMMDYEPVMSVVRKNPHVTGVAPFVLGKVMIKTQPPVGNAQFDAPVVRGVDPVAEKSISVLPSSVKIGKFDLSGRSLVVGIDLARELNLTVGDRLSVYSPANIEEMEKALAKGKELGILPTDYEVTGIFDAGFADYNSMVVVTSLENAQELYNLSTDVHGLMVKVDDAYQVHATIAQLEKSLGRDFDFLPWTDQYSVIFDALVVEKNMIRFLLFFIVLVAAFGITSSLITFVVQKTREIGMLKALGATGRQIMMIFLSQTIIVGAIGVGSGLGLGLLALKYRNEFLTFMNKVTGFQLLPAEVYKLYQLPSKIMTADLLVICGGSLLICLLAGIIPAWIAARLKPVEALRHE